MLDQETLRAWQELVLGSTAVECRATDAYAKGGRERYGIEHLPRLQACLEQANDGSLDPRWRAAIAYLDLAFFHPFVDGNARAARLVMDATLWRAGLALNLVEPVFVMARAAADNQGPSLLAIQVGELVGRR